MQKSVPFSRWVLLLASAAILAAQTQHLTLFTGTWKLNVAKSKFHPGPPPRSVTVTWAPDGSYTGDVVEADGKSSHLSRPWSGEDEVPLAVNGTEIFSLLSDYQGNTLDETVKREGKAIRTLHRVLSADGRTMTVTMEGTDAQGRPVHHVEVFEKR